MHDTRGRRRRHRAASAAAVALVAMLVLGGSVAARPISVDRPTVATAAAPRIALALRISGLTNPVFITSARDDSGRLFILEQGGRIKIRKGGVTLATPFLSLAGTVGTGSEQGLLGLAFHPQFTTNRKLYLAYNDKAANIVVKEYRASTSNPNVVNKSTARTIITIAKPEQNHNGGMLAFGPDGYLYISTGDGGGTGDSGNRAQSTNSLLGKILRIGINQSTATKNYIVPNTNPYVGVGGLDEIWQRGLRNPWRWSFDRSTGAMWIGDVGQEDWEEIDRAPMTASGPGRGINWGWHVLEGTHCYSPPSGCDKSGKTMPLAEYGSSSGRCSVIGGYVYRGTAFAALKGYYLFGDFCSGEIWSIHSQAPAPATPVRLLDTSLSISSFGEDGNNHLYVIDRGGGRIYQIVPG